MKREIKFRIWDGENIFYPKENMWFHDVKIKGIPVLQTIRLDTAIERGLTAMQYTGLKDKKGKEIYECDIVKIGAKAFYSEGLGVFEWQDWEQEGSWMKNKGGWVLKTKCQQVWESSTIEVIGNLYENPELPGTPTDDLPQGKPFGKLPEYDPEEDNHYYIDPMDQYMRDNPRK